MKRPIEWHKECLNNHRIALETGLAHIELLKAIYDRSLSQFRHLQRQIERAEKEGKDGFDAERFNMPRGIYGQILKSGK